MRTERFLIAGLLLSTSISITSCTYGTSNNAGKPDSKRVASLNTELGFRYMQEGELDLAHKKLSKALAADPSNPEAHNAMGLLKSALGESQDAEKSFLSAMNLEKNNPATANNFGQFLCQRKKYARGGKYLLQAAENPMNKNQAAAYFNLGKCKKSAGRNDQAENYFEKSLSLSPNNGATLIELAHLNLKDNNVTLANEYFKKFVSISNHNAFSLWVGYQLAVEKNDLDSVASFRLLLTGLFPESAETKLIDDFDSGR